ncbi:MAG TPA: hypothetical protein VK807_22580 [Gemmatimonadaceae bacterium]|jgi:hypothetical protein|nr:hypothetical protein [Gemmatimonadaceae bacterium]
MWVIWKSGFSRDQGSPCRPEPDLERDLDLRTPVAELHDVAGAQVGDTGDALAVDERSVPAPQVHDYEPHAAVIPRDYPRVMPPDRDVPLRVETDGRRRRAAEDQLTVRAERDDVDFGGSCAT